VYPVNVGVCRAVGKRERKRERERKGERDESLQQKENLNNVFSNKFVLFV
jgi:hypothetical protein